jgi:hypothetical protein
MENRRLALSAAVFASAPSNFLESFRQLFSAVLEARQVQWQEAQEGLDTNGNDDDDDDNGPTTTKSGTGMDFEEERLYQCLRRLKWLDGKLRRPLGEALQGSIQRAIQDRITGHFEDFNLYMEFVQAWTEAVVDPWLQTVVGPRAFDTQGWKQTLDFAASEWYVSFSIGYRRYIDGMIDRLLWNGIMFGPHSLFAKISHVYNVCCRMYIAFATFELGKSLIW